MSIGIGEHNNEHESVNHKCPWGRCKDNRFGYCYGFPSLVVDNFEYESKQDGWLVHEALQCENYQERT